MLSDIIVAKIEDVRNVVSRHKSPKRLAKGNLKGTAGERLAVGKRAEEASGGFGLSGIIRGYGFHGFTLATFKEERDGEGRVEEAIGLAHRFKHLADFVAEGVPTRAGFGAGGVLAPHGFRGVDDEEDVCAGIGKLDAVEGWGVAIQSGGRVCAGADAEAEGTGEGKEEAFHTPRA